MLGRKLVTLLTVLPLCACIYQPYTTPASAYHFSSQPQGAGKPTSFHIILMLDNRGFADEVENLSQDDDGYLTPTQHRAAMEQDQYLYLAAMLEHELEANELCSNGYDITQRVSEPTYYILQGKCVE
ncbi:hypothetical protein [Thalassotalea agarivorans]|uniref:Uncharacterized protein n=1 Tax=Thalassotalea agarivorans TaxID=349064 RepID=A0A1I0CP23_THASX|nr:hypothetical protein [Thalassotalea agarivorans]SET20770.1 hypothetical protein SAMN05660429_01253 [Thalassotalea agarivorans]